MILNVLLSSNMVIFCLIVPEIKILLAAEPPLTDRSIIKVILQSKLNRKELMTRVFYLDFTLAQQSGYSVTPKNITIMLTMLEKPVFYYSSLFLLQILDQT